MRCSFWGWAFNAITDAVSKKSLESPAPWTHRRGLQVPNSLCPYLQLPSKWRPGNPSQESTHSPHHSALIPGVRSGSAHTPLPSPLFPGDLTSQTCRPWGRAPVHCCVPLLYISDPWLLACFYLILNWITVIKVCFNYTANSLKDP